MIWIALIIPLLGAGILLIWFRDKLTWWEIFLPMAICLLVIIIFKFFIEKGQVSDTEYWGNLARTAEYVEPYTTWKDETCTRTVSDGVDSKGNPQSHTETYDCSYCDETGPRWYLNSDDGSQISISQEYYESLQKKWNSNPAFVELNRDIDYHGGCGQDGDKYVITWDEAPLTSETVSETHSYENRVQATHTAFDFPDVTADEMKTYGLYNYSEIDGYHQKTVLGLDSIQWVSSNDKLYFNKMIDYTNGEMGARKQIRVWVLFFQDKPAIAANFQESLWKGGNKNEIVICVGLSSHTNWIQWIRPFSWTTNRTLLVDVRENLMQFGKFSPVMAKVIKKDLERFKRKNFEEFSYVTVDPPFWATIVTFIITIIITFGVCYWAVINDLEADKLKPWKTIQKWY